eukprot:12255136-Alexandrium_andersonii.AAC.1
MGHSLQAALFLLARGEVIHSPLGLVHAPLDVNPDIAMGLGAPPAEAPGLEITELAGGTVDSPDPE